MEASLLPDIILSHVFSYLSAASSGALLSRCIQVCKRWRKLSLDSTLWKCAYENIVVNPYCQWLIGIDGERQINTDYRKLFIKQCLGKVWKNHGAVPLSLRGHTAPVITIDFDGKHAVTGAADNSIRVWNISTGTCTKVFQQHERPVRRVQFDDKKMLSASEDCTLRIWRLDTGRVDVVKKFDSGLKSMHFHHNNVVCAPVSPIISLFDIPSSHLSSTFSGHTAVIYSVYIQDHLVASGDAEGSVRLWDIRMNNKNNNTNPINNNNNDKNCIAQFHSLHRDKVRSISLYNYLLFTGSEDSTSNIIDMRAMTTTDKREKDKGEKEKGEKEKAERGKRGVVEWGSPVMDICFDGIRSAAACKTGVVTRADGNGGILPIGNSTCVKFIANSPTIVAGLMDYTAMVFDFNVRGVKRKLR